MLEKLGSTGKRILSYLKILKVVNKFLGGNIKITGLLSGKDIELNLKREDMQVYDKILIPDSIFNKENLTIDNYTRQDLEKISKKIKIIPENKLILTSLVKISRAFLYSKGKSISVQR